MQTSTFKMSNNDLQEHILNKSLNIKLKKHNHQCAHNKKTEKTSYAPSVYTLFWREHTMCRLSLNGLAGLLLECVQYNHEIEWNEVVFTSNAEEEEEGSLQP